MMKNRKALISLVCITVLAAVLRIWQLGSVPPSPDWDEAALGYNAYSIILTGKDEYGKFLPIVFRSFDDYKPAMYAYFTIPSILLFGLSIFAVRLPSAIIGILAVIATYFLVKELFSIKGKENKHGETIALFSAFFLAISPWHLQFSRVAFETASGMAFDIFGTLFFLKGLKNSRYLLLSTFCFGVNLAIYQSEKVFVPLLCLLLLVIYKKEIFTFSKKILLVACLVGFIAGLPLLSYTFTNTEALARARGVSVFSDQTELLKGNTQRILYDKNNRNYLGLVLDNRRILYVKTVMAGYLSHFDLNWLFITGDLTRHHAPFMGLLYLFELPLLLIGIYILACYWKTENIPLKSVLLIFGWLLITPIPASVTSGVPHAVRTLHFLPILQILIGIGAYTFWKIINKKKLVYKSTIYIAVSLFVMLTIGYYLNQYFVQQNYYNSADWQYGYQQAIEEVKKIENKYDKIIVTNKPHLDQSYIFFLFYLQYPPDKYQKDAQQASGGFAENHLFGKYEFRPIEWEKETKTGKILFVGRAEDFPGNAHIIKQIYFLDGKPAIKIVEG